MNSNSSSVRIDSAGVGHDERTAIDCLLHYPFDLTAHSPLGFGASADGLEGPGQCAVFGQQKVLELTPAEDREVDVVGHAATLPSPSRVVW
ncbi:MAG: hypothetical protein WBE40_03195 [Thermoplasmata archaeon]